ncbi:MAG: hypothetical protein RL764_57 [Pseudomonadota bacterium]
MILFALPALMLAAPTLSPETVAVPVIERPMVRPSPSPSPNPTAASPTPPRAEASPSPAAKAKPVASAPPRKPCALGCLTPVEAISFADNVAPKAGIAGEFDLTVMSVGEQQGRYYLNSETDYRERNCLTVVVTPSVVQSMMGSADLAGLAARMKGKRIAVQGIARRVRIDLTDNGQATGKYYYQVHVVVTDPRQIVMN